MAFESRSGSQQEDKTKFSLSAHLVFGASTSLHNLSNQNLQNDLLKVDVTYQQNYSPSKVSHIEVVCLT